MSSYSSYHKKYYESKKEEILQRNKDNNYWKNYYEINKEKIKEKAKIRRLHHQSSWHFSKDGQHNTITRGVMPLNYLITPQDPYPRPFCRPNSDFSVH